MGQPLKLEPKYCHSLLRSVWVLLVALAPMQSFSQIVLYVQNDSLPATRPGMYFAKHVYDEANRNVPTLDACRNDLPSPILTDDTALVSMYWKCWQIAFQHLRKVRTGSPFVSDYIDEAFNDNIFQWDTIFMIMFARYAHSIFPAVQSLDNFYCRQHESGYICREISEKTGEDFVYQGRKNTINPPLFSWAEVESFALTGDRSRFRTVLPVLEKYVEWLDRDGDPDSADGLHWEQFGRRASASPHHLFWNTGLGSGMDNTPRGGNGWVDMSCQMVIQYKNLALLCNDLDLKDRAAEYRTKARDIANRINRWCWNEHDGFYYDVDKDGNQVKWKTSGTFWPLLAGVANEEQAKRLIAHLRDSTMFWRPVVFPTLAADEKGYDSLGGYWLGGVWAPTNYMIIKGLERYGYEDFAAEATVRYLHAMALVYNETGTVWENYAPESYTPGKPAKGDFVGWSGCGPIALLIENVLGFRCDGAGNRLTWYLRRTDRHGIERLRFGTITASVIYNPPDSTHVEPTVTVVSNQPFEMAIVHDRIRTNYHLKAGTQTFVPRQTKE